MRRRFGSSLALPLLLAPVLAGCAGSGEGPGIATAGGGAAASPTVSTVAVSDEDRTREFARCMRENGIDLPDPEPGAGPRVGTARSIDPERAKAALEKCRHLLPNGGERVKLGPEQVEQMREMAKCMRANGVPDFPDPNSDGSLELQGIGLDLEDPTVRAALEKCRSEGPVVVRGGRG